MRLIFGLLALDGRPAEAAMPAMAAALAPSGRPWVRGWRAAGPVALGVVACGTGTGGAGAGGVVAGEAARDEPPGFAVPGRAASGVADPGLPQPGLVLRTATGLFAGDVRLDRPGAVADGLGLPAATAQDALARAALARHGGEVHRWLDGDYALAAWDGEAGRLVLTRDLFGVRPLCTAHVPGRFFAFAALPRGLHASGLVPARPEMAELARRVTHIYGDDLGTGYRDIAWLPAGDVMTVTADGTARAARGWRPPPQAVGRWRGSHAEAARTMRTLVDEAVAARLPARGGVAGHLSGGLDSSAVAVLAARRLHETGRRLAGIVFAAVPGPQGDAYRAAKAAILMQEPSIDAVRIVLDAGVALADIDPDVPAATCELACHARACAAAGAAGADMFLTGAGGDEGATFNGRDIHADLLRSLKWGTLLADLPLRARLDGRPLSRVVLQRLVRPLWPAWLRAAEQRLRGRQRSTRAAAAGLLAPDFRALAGVDRPPGPLPSTNTPAARIDMLFHGFLASRNTVWAVLAARHGLAFSHPLLDRRVVDFALSLPLERMLHEGHSRQPFRAAMAGILPDAVRLERMKGPSVQGTAAALAAAGPALRQEAAALHALPAAAVLDIAAVEQATNHLPDGTSLRPGPVAMATVAALSLVRHLTRLGWPGAEPAPHPGDKGGIAWPAGAATGNDPAGGCRAP